VKDGAPAFSLDESATDLLAFPHKATGSKTREREEPVEGDRSRGSETERIVAEQGNYEQAIRRAHDRKLRSGRAGARDRVHQPTERVGISRSLCSRGREGPIPDPACSRRREQVAPAEVLRRAGDCGVVKG